MVLRDAGSGTRVMLIVTQSRLHAGKDSSLIDAIFSANIEPSSSAGQESLVRQK